MDAMDAPDAALPSAVDTPVTTGPAMTTSPATVKTVTLPMALSPSRASDFMTCPLMFGFRVIDKFPNEERRGDHAAP